MRDDSRSGGLLRHRSGTDDRRRHLLKQTNTGRRLRTWLKWQGCRVDPAMQLDSCDLIANLVALGVGVSVAPIRALALYNTARTLQRIPWPDRFVRDLVVVVRRQRKLPEHLAKFIDNVLL
ncbi:MAG: LysR substrate-binding domain-containing protein [Opitutaceae bacterium]